MSFNKTLCTIRDFLTHPVMICLVFCGCFVGLYYARALVSIFDVSIFGLGLMYLTKRKNIKEALWNRHTIPFILIYLLYVFSAWYSENTGMGLHRLKVNNYYVLIPLGISMLQPFKRNYIQYLLVAFVGISTISAILVSINFAFESSISSEIYKTGKTIPTPILHIRYSYFISLALLIGFALYLRRSQLHPLVRRILPFALGLLFLFLHVLAVRSGLLAFYAGFILFAMVAGKKYLRPQYLIGAVTGFLIVLVLAVNFIPSLKNKWQYTRHDLKMFLQDTGHYLYSDNLRLISIKNGLQLIESYPMLGVGIGDIEDEMQYLYKTYYPDIPSELQALPINQIVYTLTAFGLVGGILFFIFLFYPISYSEQWRDPLLLVIYGATLGSFMGDASIELQLGKVAFVTMTTLALWHVYPEAQVTTKTQTERINK